MFTHSCPPRPQTVQQAVLWTLAWFDLFSQPLTAREVCKWLFAYKADLPRVELALKEGNYIARTIHGGETFYHLRGRENLVNIRLRRERTARVFWDRVDKTKGIFKFLPHIKLVAVGNTLAFGFPDGDSDIDLLVVTAKNRIWSARLSITGALHWRGLRRHDHKVSGRFCLSFFAAEDAINFATVRREPCDPYLALWILTLTPVFEEDNFSARFWAENIWAKEYFPNYPLQKPNNISHRTRFSSAVVWLREKIGNHLVERIIRYFLRPRTERKARLLPKNNDTVVSDKMLKFHESDARRQLYLRWLRTLEDLGCPPVHN